MRKIITLTSIRILISLFLGFGIFTNSQCHFQGQGYQFNEFFPPYIPGEILVKFKEPMVFALKDGHFSVNNPSVENILHTYNLKEVQTLFKRGKVAKKASMKNIFRLKFPVEIAVEEVVQAFQALKEVDFAEPNPCLYLCTQPNDPYYIYQWNLRGALFAGINAEPAWDITTGNESVILAIIDTGIVYTHEDLKNKMWRNTKEVAGNGIDDDGNGFVDDIYGYNFYDENGDPMDKEGHGTGCAGIAAAQGNNNLGIAGVAWRCKIMAVRCGEIVIIGSMFAEGITYATDNKAEVINCSNICLNHSGTIKAAIDYAYENDVVVCCAMGNELTNNIHYPSAYAETIAVGATGMLGDRSFFSNTGIHCDICAPGTECLGTDKNGGYDITGTGTSHSTPHIAGTAVLLKSLYNNPRLSNEEIRQLLIQTAIDVGTPGFDEFAGYGRLDAGNALMRATNRATIPPIAIIRQPLINNICNDVCQFMGTAKIGAVSTSSFDKYKLSYKMAGMVGIWQEFALSEVPVEDDLLGTLDMTPLQNGKYEVILEVWDKNGNYACDRTTICKSVDPALHPGWPVKLPGQIASSVALVDLDDDNTLEIIITCGDGKTYVFHHNGELMAGWPQKADAFTPRQIPAENYAAPTVGDIDRDGKQEILVPSSNGYLYCYKPDGSKKEDWNVYIEGGLGGACAISDVNNDGYLEIAAGSFKGEMYLLDHRGNVMPGWPKNGNKAFISTPALVDINGDLNVDIVCGNNDSRVYAWNRNGELLDGFPVVLEGLNTDVLPIIGEGVSASIAIADLDDDPKTLEIIAAATSGNLFMINYRGEKTRISGIEQYIFNSPPSIADVNKDGVPEIACGVISAPMDALGMGLWTKTYQGWTNYGNWPFSVVNHVMAPSAIIDIDGDGDRDILVGCSSDWVYAWGPAGESPKGWNDWGGNKRFTGYWVFAGVSVGDIDNDGKLETVVPDRRGMIWVWDEVGDKMPTDKDWFTFHHDYWRTGVYGKDTLRPAVIRDLKTEFSGSDALKLVWTAPGDDGIAGRARKYQIKMNTVEVNYQNWDKSFEVANELMPAEAGAREELIVGGLAYGRRYFFAIKTEDEAGNVSGISNNASGVVGEEEPTPTPTPPSNRILFAGYWDTRLVSYQGGYFKLYAVPTIPQLPQRIQSIEILYQGIPIGLRLNDLGVYGDLVAGDGLWGYGIYLSSPLNPIKALLELVAVYNEGNISSPWPFLNVY